MYHHHRRRHYYQWYHRLLRVVVAAVVVELFVCHHLDHNSCCGFCFNTHCNKIVATTGTSSFSSTLLSNTHNSNNNNSNNDNDNDNDVNHVHDDEWKSFSIPLTVERPQPTSVFDTWNRLWNDPRPVSSLIQDAIKSNSNSNNDEENSTIPYCLLSEEFLVPAVSDDDDLDDDHKQHRFQISVFPRGRFATSSASSKANTGQSSGVYLKYIPDKYGDEVDVLWKLTLVDTADTTIKLLPILTSGGLPKSDTTFTCGMTFCVLNEDIESCGRAADWGASTWYQEDVCDAVSIPNTLEAHVQMKICGSRSGESSFRFRNFNNNNNNNNNKEGGGKFKLKGALGAVYYSQIDAGTVLLNNNNNNKTKQSRGIGEERRKRRERSFRVGEVIVPMAGHENEKILENTYLVTAGTDYRIMTMTDQYGRSIFSTKDVPKEERKYVKLALRPCGWKQLQRQQRQNKHNSDTPITVTDWPVEVDAGLLSSSALSRFNIAATAVPRFVSTFRRDQTAVLLGIALALLPLPGALIGRNYVSLYAIPSASMDPTLIKGDVLLVEKFPHVYDRTNRGDIVLFRPPSALTDIIGTINRNSLFVKRVVGIPGDTDIVLDLQTKEVTINSNSNSNNNNNNNNNNLLAVGPDRNLCDDEPLKLIDKFLENGKGKYIKSLDTNEVYVLGDCKSVSIDSRVFGTLPTDNIQGKPIMRIWPPSRITIKKL